MSCLAMRKASRRFRISPGCGSTHTSPALSYQHLVGPVVNKKRRRQIFDADGRFLRANAPFVGDPTMLVGDYSNAILKPSAAEIQTA
jgi:hypothetical protein